MIAPKILEETGDLLGGRRIVGKISSSFDLDECVRSGLRVTALQAFAKHIKISPAKLAAAIGIPPATYDRRSRQTHLSRYESEILGRVARLVALGNEIFGTSEATWRWLGEPNRGWDEKRPIDLLQTELGGREVEAALGRRILGGYD